MQFSTFSNGRFDIDSSVAGFTKPAVMQSPQNIFLGIDGGGTGCRALIVDAVGHVLGSGKGPLANYHHAGWDGAERALADVFSDATAERGLSGPCSAAFLGLAGVTAAADRERFAEIAARLNFALPKGVDVDHDVRIAHAGGLAGQPGIALIAGTGSSSYGRSADGRSWYIGWDALADDAGSGYWLGLRAIQLGVRAADGRGEPTALEQIVFSFLQIRGLDELMARMQSGSLGKREIASLAPRVLESADGGDAVAARLCVEGAEELALMISTVAGRIRSPEEGVHRVIFAGSLALAPSYNARIRAALDRLGAPVRIEEAQLPPVGGAALLALAHAGILSSPSIVANLQTYFRSA